MVSDLRSLSLPDSWEIRTIESLGEVVTGTTPSTSHPEYYGRDVPFVSPADLNDKRFVSQTERSLTQEGAGKARLLPQNSVLVTCIGNLGKVGQASVSLATNQQINSFIPHSEIDESFAYWVMHTLQRQLEIEAGLQVVPIVNKTTFSNLQLPLPPFPEQRRIAEILDAADEAIRQTERVIAKLREVKRGLLHDLLTRGLDAAGNLRDPVAHPEQFRDSPLGRIPREWRILPFEDLARINRGKFTHRPRNDPDYYGGKYPFIQTGDITSAEGGVIRSYSQTLSERGKSVSREFPVGTIAISIAANIADTAILGIPMYFPDSVVGAVVHAPHNNRYVELYIRRAKRRLEAQAPQSAQKNINLGVLRPLPIPVPSPSEQTRIANSYEALAARIRAEETVLAKRRQVKRGLMEDLLTGRVRV